MSELRLTGAALQERVHAIGIFVGDQVEQLLMGALELRGADNLEGRVSAIALLARDMAERTLHESISLMNGVMHSDVASFTRQLEEFKHVQTAFSSSVAALAEQYAQTAAAQRELAVLMREVVEGLRAERRHESATA